MFFVLARAMDELVEHWAASHRNRRLLETLSAKRWLIRWTGSEKHWWVCKTTASESIG
jgi:hypothetical protein